MTPAQEELRDFMCELSQKYLFAGWHINLEYILWEIAVGPRTWLGFGDLPPEIRPRLKALSRKIRGWIYWKGKYAPNSGPAFIPMKKWLVKFKKYMARRDK